MTEVTGFAQLATRAANLADRAEAAGLLVVASVLRGVAADVEELILETMPPVVRRRRGGPKPAPLR
jgi:hypothetical protein